MKSQRHLLADPGIIQRATDMPVRVQPPERAEPVITRDHPWERVLLGLYLTAVDDGGKVRIWYGCRSDSTAEGKHTAYAESDDGVEFVKPAVSDTEIGGRRAHNIVIPETMEGTLYIDPNEVPERRYCYFGNYFGRGLYRWTSPDGLRFSRDPEALLSFECDSQCVLVPPEDGETYAAYVRSWRAGEFRSRDTRGVMRLTHTRADEPWPYPPSGGDIRAAGRDRLPHFTEESDIVFECDNEDPPETDVYTLQPQRYGSYWFAFPTLYHHFAEDNDGSFRNAGRTSVQCLGSPDGVNWQRYDRGSYARPAVGENMAYMGYGMIHRGDEIWQYGFGYDTHHGEVQRRARDGDGTMYRFAQRVDGFAAAVADSRGSLETTSLECAGRRLLVNLDTDGIGSTRVAVLDTEGQALPGLSAEKCKPLMVNSTGVEVRWRGASLDRHVGSTVRLQFECERTRLFSFWFE